MILILWKVLFHTWRFGFKQSNQKRKNRTLICWDQCTGSGSFDGLQGAEVLFTQQQLDGIQQKRRIWLNQHGAWMSVMKGHAVANGVMFSSKQNWFRTILPDTAEFSFGIFVIAGHKVKFCASLTRQRRNPDCRSRFRLTENVRQNWPFFRDRRIDALVILQKERLTKCL